MASTYCLSYPDGSGPTYLDEGPAEYYDGPPERRASAHVTATGRVWQDFGAPACDRQIRLRTDWMGETTLGNFASKYEETGQVWLWSEGESGPSYLVFFRALNPERIRGYDAYRVEMVFDVIEEVS